MTTVKIGCTYELIVANRYFYDLLERFAPSPLHVPLSVANNASHENWQVVIDLASYINDAYLFTNVLPWATIRDSRVPADWPNALVLDDEGQPTTVRKRWWEYTRVWLDAPSAVATEGILQMNIDIQDAAIVEGRFVTGHFKNGLTDEMLRKYLVLTNESFLTWKEGLAIINSWSSPV